MHSEVIEQVVYRLRPEADASEFARANDAIDSFLARQRGFVGRQLAQDPDGTLVDIVRWTDRQSAVAAAVAFTEAPEGATAAALIEPDGMEFRHLDLIRAVEAPTGAG